MPAISRRNLMSLCLGSTFITYAFGIDKTNVSFLTGLVDKVGSIPFVATYTVGLSDSAALKTLDDKNFDAEALRLIAGIANDDLLRRENARLDSFKRGLLLSSTRSLSIEQRKIVYVSVWKTREAFAQFIEQSGMIKIDSMLQDAGMITHLNNVDPAVWIQLTASEGALYRSTLA